MSSIDQPVDQQLIEQTKRQIQSLVNEIAQLTKQNLSPADFYNEFLTRVVSSLAALGGVVWTVNDEGRLALQVQINFQQTNLQNNETDQARHGRLLYKAMSSAEGMLAPPHSGAGENEEGNPTDFLLVLAPLRTDLEVVGVVEIFQRTDAGQAIQRGYLRFLLQMCELAGDFLKSHQLRHFSDRQVLWSRLEDFARTVHNSLEATETAYTIANEGRRLIECDRVSVAINRGRKCTIEAVSGQDVFDKRSNTIRLLGRLASAVVATGEPVWYTGDTRDMAPQVEEAVQQYIDESHSKTVAVLPLLRPRLEEEDSPESRTDPPPPIGALIVEQIEDSRLAPAMAQRIEVVCRHSCTALGNAMEHENLFLMPVWRALGKTRWIIKSRTLPKTLTIAGAVLAVLLALVLWPADFNLQSKGTLEPKDRQDVYAGIDGIVSEVLVKHGKMVKKDEVLARLRNTEVEMTWRQVTGQLVASKERVLSLQRTLLDERQLRPEERQRLFGELAEERVKLISLESQKEVCEQKRRDLVVKSPIDGQVVTWDVENRLIRRPVMRGQLLMRIADPKGDWQLELHMPEDRMGFISRARNDFKAKDEEKDLPVTYILATEPGVKRAGTVNDVYESAEPRGEEGITVLIKVGIQPKDFTDTQRAELFRPGATVTAKVYCGRRAIGYVWFHDLIAFVQSRILFRL